MEKVYYELKIETTSGIVSYTGQTAREIEAAIEIANQSNQLLTRNIKIKNNDNGFITVSLNLNHILSYSVISDGRND